MKRIILVSNFLPVQMNQMISKSMLSLSSVFMDAFHDREIVWVGWNGITTDKKILDSPFKIDECDFTFINVNICDDEIENYYVGFANSSLWPLLHYVSIFARYDETWFVAYKAVNERFAHTIAETAHEDDLVWIHDYHLMLVPEILKQLRPELKIGFFFHTPFPSFELFRCHPKRCELLEGVLGANLIGFQTFGYMRHFRSTVLRLLGVESEMKIIPNKNGKCHINVFPVGINWNRFKDEMISDEYKKKVAEYNQIYANKRVVLSIENFDYSKGIQRKLQSIEKFLEYYPEEREKTIFIIIAMPSRSDNLSEYEHYQHDVTHLVGEINGCYSTLSNIPILFLNRNIDFAELCALYTISDVALITPLMDGMNLVAKEYVACQKDDGGVLILSEFAGAAQELFNAIMVNPYNIDEVAKAIHQALHLSYEQKRESVLPMKSRILRYDMTYWANSFIKELEMSKHEMSWISTEKTLDSKIIDYYKCSKGKKALFLDYDGTLREFVDNPNAAVPESRLLEALELLTKRTDIDVYIISGRKVDFLQKHFGHLNLTLIGEHGYFFRSPMGEWKESIGLIDLSWKDKILEIYTLYSLSTPGTHVEEKTSAIVWHYRKADPEFGAWKAQELIGNLTEAISNLPVEIHHGKKIVEVTSQHINKGVAVGQFINENNYETVLCIGDDKTDETMFNIKDANMITVKVGDGETVAEYRVYSPSDVRKFIYAISF